MASPFAVFLQAQSADRVTSLRHEQITLPELERRLLLNLDCTRVRPELLEMLLGLVQRGALTVEEQGQRVEATARARELLSNPLEQGLIQLAGMALLVK